MSITGLAIDIIHFLHRFSFSLPVEGIVCVLRGFGFGCCGGRGRGAYVFVWLSIFQFSEVFVSRWGFMGLDVGSFG